MASISLDDAGAARAWFRDVIEPLADSFDAGDVDRYVRVFGEVLGDAQQAANRFARIRSPRPFQGPDPEQIAVLSRVTLGADAAITSVLLDAMKRRFPRSRIWFAGSEKGYELFAGDPRIGHLPATYRRTGSIAERLAASRSIDLRDMLVVDPDSRLTQLGLVPVCPDENYYFFDSRSPREPGTLGQLAARWAAKVFGIEGAQAFLAPPAGGPVADITVSLGVGENPAKRLDDAFERGLIAALARTGASVLVDQGAGGEETERVLRATAGVPNVSLFQGSFARFASAIRSSRYYVGYDSAGQHAAAALGVPLTAIFAGFPNERFLERWRPSGPGPIQVLRADLESREQLIARVVKW